MSAPAIVGVLLTALLQGSTFHSRQETFQTSDGALVQFGRAVPDDYTATRPRPLVVALHPGGEHMPGNGARYMRSIFLPGVRDLGPIVVAPDCPGRSWADPICDRAVTVLIEKTRAAYAIDPRRILVVGFSMGGMGAWFMESRHPDLFSGAIVVAGSTSEPLDGLAKVPTYVIHSRADQVVPFDQAEQRAAALERLGRPVVFKALEGLGHYDMTQYVPAIKEAAQWIMDGWHQQ